MNLLHRRNDFVNRLRLAIAVIMALAAVLLFAFAEAIAEPTEEDLPPVPAPHSSAADTTPSAQTNPDYSTSPQSATNSDTTSDTGSDDTAKPPLAAPADTAGSEQSAQAPAQPHHAANYFPYTIRPGDSLHSIGNLFGVDSAVIAHINHIDPDNPDLIAGRTLRIPNPYLAKMHDLEGQIDRLSAERAEINQQATTAQNQLATARHQLQDISDGDRELRHEVAVLPWWRTATYAALLAAVLMFGMMAVALFEWLTLRGRFRAVAEMNEALRRLDYRYRGAVAKAELRLQELYGRRRRGFEDGQDRPRIAEDTELERLHAQLKEILEAHLSRLGPPGGRARRARWRELIGGIGAPAEARSARR